MTQELQSTLEASSVWCPALRNQIRCLAHVKQLALGAILSSLGVKGLNKSWEANERDQQFGENQRIDIGKSQRLRKEGNARVHKVSAMKLGLAEIIQNVRISWYFGSPEIGSHIAENACCIDYADTWSSKRVLWVSTSQSPHHRTSDYAFEDTVELNIGVTSACQPIAAIHQRVAPKSKI